MKDRIKVIRKDEDMTQTEFANELGFGKSTVVKWESGVTEPNAAAQKLICSTFDINEQWLLTGEGEKKVDRSDEDAIDAFCGDVKHLPADDPRRFIMKLLARLSDDDWIAIADIIAKTRDQE